MGWIWTMVAVAAAAAWFAWRRVERVACEVELESTHEHLHAHVTLAGVEVEPGDEVRVQGAPARIPFGRTATLQARAEVRRASRPRRWWTKVTGVREFYELYDVGFEG